MVFAPAKTRGALCVIMGLFHVSFAYPDSPLLLNDVNVSLQPGERVALIGANGAGKSTLLQLLLQWVPPNKGHVTNTFGPAAVFLDAVAEDRSWGQAAYAQISALLVHDPALLILDEPTRHLDLDHRRQLAQWLLQSHAAMVIVSHDWEFLDAVVTTTWHLEDGVVKTAMRPPSEYWDQRARDRAAYQRRYDSQQSLQRRLLQDIAQTKEQARRTEHGTRNDQARRYAKKVAKKAVSREKRLEKLEHSDDWLEAPRDPHRLRHTWDHVDTVPGVISRLEGVTLYRDSIPILSNIYAVIRGGERIAVVGPNGAGKSSLLDVLVGRFTGSLEGRLRLPSTDYGYVHQVFEGLRESTWQYFSQRSRIPEGLGRAWLQSYGFLPLQLSLPTSSLSHGEQVKLQVAAATASGVGFLILDEPEHHLDWPSLNVISEGLSSYPGTLVVVSHQPQFLDTLGMTTLWEVSGGSVKVGPWLPP